MKKLPFYNNVKGTSVSDSGTYKTATST